VIAVSSALGVPAFAASDIDTELRSQHQRIADGVRSGQLTRSEAIQLQAEQDRIAAQIRRARSDGRIDPYERREIEQAQAVASRHVYAQKHDSEVQARPSQPRR
jgi:uncharacterized membrane protein YebE (DUF533 family)